MKGPIWPLLSRAYLATLLAAALLFPMPYPVVALVLLVAVLFGILRPLPRLDIVLSLATFFLLPLMLASFLQYVSRTPGPPSLMVQLLSVVVAAPALYLLDSALRQNAPDLAFVSESARRLTTPVSRSLFTAGAAIIVLSLFVGNSALLLAGVAFVLYLGATLLRVISSVPAEPIDIPVERKRIVAGTTSESSLSAAGRTRLRLYCRVEPANDWVTVEPQEFTIRGDAVKLRLSVTPPLSGPAHPGMRASVIDRWGLLQTNQDIEPMELHVVPRARYAEWLATRFLEQGGARVEVSSSLSSQAARLVRGVEYDRSRSYLPGDRLKDIDWKHSMKLQQLIAREYADAAGQSAIIAVNLSVPDAEGADRLAFNLVTAALTLAYRAIPTALAAYDHERVVATIPSSSPEEAVKHALALVKDITLVTVPEYRLQPPDVGKLRRSMSNLERAESPPARHMLEILSLEYRAIEKAARSSPATLALTQVIRRHAGPAIIILISQLDPVPEAIWLMMEKLESRGFSTLCIQDGD